jgi:hypothetical protein
MMLRPGSTEMMATGRRAALLPVTYSRAHLLSFWSYRIFNFDFSGGCFWEC